MVNNSTLDESSLIVYVPLVYGVPLEVRMYDAGLESAGVDVSGAAKSLVRAVGVLVLLVSADLFRSTGLDGSSTSFSTLACLAFLPDDVGLSFS